MSNKRKLHWLYKKKLCMENVDTWNWNVSETKYLKYKQNIEGNSSFRKWKCENFLSSLAYNYYIHFLNVSVLSVYCRLYIASYYKWCKESALIVYYVCRCYLRPENKCFWEKVSEVYQQNDEGITVLDCENVKKFKLARCARSHIHKFFLILVSCQYNVVYIAP